MSSVLMSHRSEAIFVMGTLTWPLTLLPLTTVSKAHPHQNKWLIKISAGYLWLVCTEEILSCCFTAKHVKNIHMVFCPSLFYIQRHMLRANNCKMIVFSRIIVLSFVCYVTGAVNHRDQLNYGQFTNSWNQNVQNPEDLFLQHPMI